MNALESATAEEAINLEPLSRFRYRQVKFSVDDANQGRWIVWCGHRSINENFGMGTTLADAIFDAGIDTDEKPTHTD